MEERRGGFDSFELRVSSQEAHHRGAWLCGCGFLVCLASVDICLLTSP